LKIFFSNPAAGCAIGISIVDVEFPESRTFGLKLCGLVTIRP